MADLSIRNLDDTVRDLLRQRAAQRGHSMEAEVRSILEAAVRPAENWLWSLHRACAAEGGIELATPPRDEAARGAEFAP
jgi:plasmid stability protein